MRIRQRLGSQMEIGALEHTSAAQREGFPAERRTEDLERISGAAAGASGAAFPDIPVASDSIGPAQRQHRRPGGGAQVQDGTRVFPQQQAYQSDPQEHRERTQSGPEERLRSGFGAEIAGAD